MNQSYTMSLPDAWRSDTTTGMIVLLHQSSSSLDSERSTVDVTAFDPYGKRVASTRTSPSRRRVWFEDHVEYHENYYCDDDNLDDEQEHDECQEGTCWYTEHDYERFERDAVLELQQIFCNAALLSSALQLARSYDEGEADTTTMTTVQPLLLDVALLGLERRLNFQSIQSARQDLYKHVDDWQSSEHQDEAEDQVDENLRQLCCPLTQRSRRYAQYLANQWQSI